MRLCSSIVGILDRKTMDSERTKIGWNRWGGGGGGGFKDDIGNRQTEVEKLQSYLVPIIHNQMPLLYLNTC